jgi:hypothetical protein
MEAPDGQEMKYAQAGWGCAVENTSSKSVVNILWLEKSQPHIESVD